MHSDVTTPRIALAAGLALTALLVLAASAAATTTRVLGRGTQSPNTAATATAVCPAGKQLVGGGFALDPAYDPVAGTGARALVQEAFPGDRRGWKVRSFAPAGGTDSALYAIGLCRSGAIVRRSVAVSVPVASYAVVRVACPRDRHVIGGGYSVVSPYDPDSGTGANVFVHTSRRIDRHTWLVGATRDYGDSADLLAYALCEPDWRTPVWAASATVTTDGIGRYTASADCPRFTGVVSGGFEARPLGTPGNALTTGLVPWLSANRPLLRKTGWTATIHDETGTAADGRLTVYAYCKVG